MTVVGVLFFLSIPRDRITVASYGDEGIRKQIGGAETVPEMQEMPIRYPSRIKRRSKIQAPMMSFRRNSFPSGDVNRGRSRSVTTILRCAVTFSFLTGL